MIKTHFERWLHLIEYEKTIKKCLKMA